MKVKKSMKNNKVFAVLFLLVLSFVMPKNLKSQMIEVGATASIPYYVGDLNPDKHFSNVKPSFGGVLRYYQNLRWAFRLQYSHYNLQVQPTQEILNQIPEYANEENYKFPIHNRVNDFALLAEFNFFNYWTGSNNNYVTPYIFAGLSAFNYASDNNEANLSMSVPFGAGVKYSIAKGLGVSLEWRMNKTFADDIDNKIDVSGDFDFAYDNDWIGALELSIVYSFNLPKKANCNSGITTR
jgi:hypothetical protein